MQDKSNTVPPHPTTTTTTTKNRYSLSNCSSFINGRIFKVQKHLSNEVRVPLIPKGNSTVHLTLIL